MTMGQRIAEQRKKLGISQEALGEKMGVSRQAISKWEADGAVPEIDKLIALSKLFGVSVGWLLGVEEAPAPTQSPEDLTEKQLYLIEEIVKKYQPQPPKAYPHKILKGILVGGVASLVLFTCLMSLRRMDDLTALENQVSSVLTSQYNLDSRIAALETAGQAVQPTPALLADYSFDLEQLTEEAGAGVAFVAAPNSWQEGDQGYLDIRSGEGTVLHQLCDWSGSFLSADFTLEALDGYKLCFTVVHADGTQEQQLLYDEAVEDLKSALTLTASVTPGPTRYVKGTMILENYKIFANMPQLGYVYGSSKWERIDLVFYRDQNGDKVEIGRFNVLRSSASSNDDVLYSPSVAMEYIEITLRDIDLSTIFQVHLYIEAEMANGLSTNSYVTTLTLQENGDMIS